MSAHTPCAQGVVIAWKDDPEFVTSNPRHYTIRIDRLSELRREHDQSFISDAMFLSILRCPLLANSDIPIEPHR